MATGFSRAKSVVHRGQNWGPTQCLGSALGLANVFRQQVFEWIETWEGFTLRKAALGGHCAGVNWFSLC